MTDSFDHAVALAKDLLSSPPEFVMRDLHRLDQRTIDGYLAHRALNLELRRRLRELQAKGQPIPYRLQPLADAMARGEPPPGAPRGRPSNDREHWALHREITPERLWWSGVRGAVEAIVEANLLHRERNREARQQRSACDAVILAAKQLGRHITYDKVEKLTRP